MGGGLALSAFWGNFRGRMASGYSVTRAGGVTPAKEKIMTDVSKKYTKNDFSTMSLQVGALKDFAELLDYNYDREANGPTLASIALIIKTLLDPVGEFLSWAATYAEIPEGKEKQGNVRGSGPGSIKPNGEEHENR